MSSGRSEPADRASEEFPVDPAGLPEAAPGRVVDLGDGDHYQIRVAPVAKRIGSTTVRMLAYNGCIPGPQLRVRQGSQVSVTVLNEGDTEATVHWHGLRLDNRYDGTGETQPAIPIGGRFTYQVRFPDPGGYWYHPHIREDYNQEMGLYGTIVVAPLEADYWPAVHREQALTLDDILIEHGTIAPFRRAETSHAAMGRFGNIMLTSGEPRLALSARRDEVIRFYLTNTANTRTFNVCFAGARMKLVGGDSGHYEHEEIVGQVLIAPSERAVVDVLFPGPGQVTLEHHTPERTYSLATVAVSGEPATPALAHQFGELRSNADMAAERQRLAPYAGADPDKTLAMAAEMAMTRTHHPDHGTGGHPAGHDRTPAPIEWEDDMAEMNQAATQATMRWKFADQASGAEGQAIDWHFRVGDQVKIRLTNQTGSAHPMQHPIHIHGAGRFLILARDGVTEPNLVWKDTVLVPAGQTTDILLDVTNPGGWMLHCHIAEHHETGMMFNFTVEP